MTSRRAAWSPRWRVLLGLLATLGWLGTPAAPAAATPAIDVLMSAAPTEAEPPPAQSGADHALLQLLRPEVQWSPVGAIRWQDIAGEQVVNVGDRVRTGPGAAARLRYFDGTVTEVGPETGLLVQRLERAPDGGLIARIFQAAGDTVNRVLPAVAGLTQFEIETPAVFVRARGTTPRMQVDGQSGTTRVASIPDGTGGLVAVEGKDPAATAVTLNPGEETTIVPGQAPAQPRPAACATGFQAEYFDNPDLRGAPVLVRCDPAVHFNWGRGAPAPAVPADGFSVRWRGQLTIPSDGNYTFGAQADDGVRVYLDGTIVLDQWLISAANTASTRRFVSRGPHQVVVEYFDASADANIRIDWPVPPD